MEGRGESRPFSPLFCQYSERPFFPSNMAAPPSAVAEALLTLSSHLLRTFLGIVTFTSLYHARRLFLEPTGRSHRLAGLAHLLCILAGALFVVAPPPITLSANGNGTDGSTSIVGGDWASNSWSYQCLIYDICLGVLGTATTLTAARAFPHKTLTNAPGQSGTLSEHAYVTQGEMIEHSFYQMLNLIQAMYLHSVTWILEMPELHNQRNNNNNESDHDGNDHSIHSIRQSLEPMLMRLAAVWLVTAPWLCRHLFPVNSFSANWIKNREMNGKKGKPGIGKQNSWLETKLYQIKKWQYVFYKHTILHGLNISVAFPAKSAVSESEAIPLPLSSSWRIFWVCLNSSYVFEFYLQSLVKRRFISQRSMLALQRVLMTASSISALLAVKGVVRPEVCVMSVIMNLANRGHDVLNVLSVSLAAGIPSIAAVN